MRRLVLLAAALLALASAPVPAPAQEAPATAVEAARELDYEAWDRLAGRAEDALESGGEADALNELRAQVSAWRDDFRAAASTNAGRLTVLRDQIAALGPVPAEGETEPEELAARRAELGAQLRTLQAPGIAAEEAFSRADALIREIDRLLRERQTDQLLRLLPSPVNPGNWPAAAGAVGASLRELGDEVASRWARPALRDALLDSLPAILALTVVALALLARGRGLIEALVGRLTRGAGGRGRRVWALVLSLGQILVPALGALLLAVAIQISGLGGPRVTPLTLLAPVAAAIVFGGFWLGARLFPREEGARLAGATDGEAREGRWLAPAYGLVLAFQVVWSAILGPVMAEDEAVRAVLGFPALLLAGLLLIRTGRLLRRIASRPREDAESHFGSGVTGTLGRLAQVAGLAGPVLAAVGYVPAAEALVFPAGASLGLIGLLWIAQGFIGDLYATIVRDDEAARSALVPVLAGFALALAALPLFALLWGARPEDISELWARARTGFMIGTTRVSPADFLVVIAVFGAGFALTRVVQGALKATVLPRTRLDQGGQNAVVSGVGYIGVFLAGLMAITAAGIDLTGLAFVAGALSLGLGFGLKTIVENFVSGIILLVERPVSEGDWIDVGGTQGIVKAISVRSTRIQTFDRTDVIVPNAELVQGRVTNWTRFNMSGRLIVPVGVAYGSDTRKVERVLREIAEAQPLAILNPPPIVVFTGFGADSLDFEIRVIIRDVNFSLSVRTEINHQIAERFAAEGIEIPFRQADVSLRNVDEIAAALRPSVLPPLPE